MSGARQDSGFIAYRAARRLDCFSAPLGKPGANSPPVTVPMRGLERGPRYVTFAARATDLTSTEYVLIICGEKLVRCRSVAQESLVPVYMYTHKYFLSGGE